MEITLASVKRNQFPITVIGVNIELANYIELAAVNKELNMYYDACLSNNDMVVR